MGASPTAGGLSLPYRVLRMMPMWLLGLALWQQPAQALVEVRSAEELELERQKQAPPVLWVDAEPLKAEVVEGESVELRIKVRNDGGQTLRWSVDAPAWVHAMPGEGLLGYEEGDEIVVTLGTPTLAPGPKEGVVSVSSRDGGGPVDVPVHLDVMPAPVDIAAVEDTQTEDDTPAVAVDTPPEDTQQPAIDTPPQQQTETETDTPPVVDTAGAGTDEPTRTDRIADTDDGTSKTDGAVTIPGLDDDRVGPVPRPVPPPSSGLSGLGVRVGASMASADRQPRDSGYEAAPALSLFWRPNPGDSRLGIELGVSACRGSIIIEEDAATDDVMAEEQTTMLGLHGNLTLRLSGGSSSSLYLVLGGAYFQEDYETVNVQPGSRWYDEGYSGSNTGAGALGGLGYTFGRRFDLRVEYLHLIDSNNVSGDVRAGLAVMF